MILDQNGGPWLVSPIHGNPEDNIQHPIVVIDRQTRQVTYTGLYYYLAHFSKFVRPGAVRLATGGGKTGVRCVAFKTPEGGFVAELLNSQNESAEVGVRWRNRSLRVPLPAVSITTCLWRE
jgi:glucosylceramidase